MTRRINRILRGFNRAAAKLQKLENQGEAKIAGEHDLIDYHRGQIDQRYQKIDAHQAEIIHARNVRQKIESLIS